MPGETSEDCTSDISTPDVTPSDAARLARFDRIIRGTSSGMWEWDLAGDNVSFFGGYWRQLGYSDEFLKRVFCVEELRAYCHPEDWDILTEALQQVLAGQDDLVQSLRLRNAKGGYCWTQIEATASRDAEGRVTYLSGIAFDITDQRETELLLRQSEERHARILSATSDGIWEWSAESGGFHFSSRCWEHLGYNGEDDSYLEGRNRLHVWRERIHPEDRERFDTSMLEHLKKRGTFDIEYRIEGKDGRWRWIRARGQASYDKWLDKPVHVSGTNMDITDQKMSEEDDIQAVRMSGTNMDITNLKEAEERVLQAKEDAERANQAKSDFLSSMSHELRTPLNAILGYTQLFGLDSNLTDNQLENVAEIRKAGELLLQLIGDVLDLSKIESGKLTLSVEPVMPMRILQECIKLIQPLAETKNIKLWATPNQLAECYIRADATRLKQALLNLMSNAVKYNQEGGDVEISFVEPDDGLLRIEVRDTGPGIPLERQSEVFEPFNRLGAEGSSIEGSGVGLIITKRLVNMMGGELSFVSREGQGTRFWLELPLVKEWSASNVVARSEVQPVVGKLTELKVQGRKRILYIEDNPSNLRLMEQLLMRYPQLELLTANEAFYGVYRARTESPDMIILDINLPGMDGFEALSVLRQDRKTGKLPIIALSANAMSYDLERGKEAGFDIYLTKPLELDKLIEAFNTLLG
jgi:PAS domain S-box-containing protein